MKFSLLSARKGSLNWLSSRLDYADSIATLTAAEAKFPAQVGIISRSA
jgi:hypothetical protein